MPYRRNIISLHLQQHPKRKQCHRPESCPSHLEANSRCVGRYLSGLPQSAIRNGPWIVPFTTQHRTFLGWLLQCNQPKRRWTKSAFDIIGPCVIHIHSMNPGLPPLTSSTRSVGRWSLRREGDQQQHWKVLVSSIRAAFGGELG